MKRRDAIHAYRFVLVIFVFSLTVVQANAMQVYINDFQSVANNEWSNQTRSLAPTVDSFHPEGRWFLGEFTNDVVTLSLGKQPIGLVALSFDAYFIRSWDGNGYGGNNPYGPDNFKVSVPGSAVLLDATFSSSGMNQSYTGTATERYSLGYSYYDGSNGNVTNAMDSVYHFDLSFYNYYEDMKIAFSGYGLQNNITTKNGISLGYVDESWGLDNVIVDITPVPEPTTLVLMLGGITGLFILRGRNKMR